MGRWSGGGEGNKTLPVETLKRDCLSTKNTTPPTSAVPKVKEERERERPRAQRVMFKLLVMVTLSPFDGMPGVHILLFKKSQPRGRRGGG
jgi:hypothetical protein